MLNVIDNRTQELRVPTGRSVQLLRGRQNRRKVTKL